MPTWTAEKKNQNWMDLPPTADARHHQDYFIFWGAGGSMEVPINLYLPLLLGGG